MDEFTFWIIVIIAVFLIIKVLSPKKITNTKITEAYHKKSQNLWRGLGVVTLIVSFLIFFAVYSFLEDDAWYGLILFVLAILVILGYKWLYGGDWKNLEKMKNKQEEDKFKIKV